MRTRNACSNISHRREEYIMVPRIAGLVLILSAFGAQTGHATSRNCIFGLAPSTYYFVYLNAHPIDVRSASVGSGFLEVVTSQAGSYMVERTHSGHWEDPIQGPEEESDGSDFLAPRFYPNPCRGSLHIAFLRAAETTSRLRVFNAGGELVAGAWDPPGTAGLHRWDIDLDAAAGRSLPRGVYWVQFSTGERTTAGKLVLTGR
jgi:hypothetical protein